MTQTQPNILIVDDEPDNLRILSAILKNKDYRVRQALSGETALESIKALLPDLILLDVIMPQMDGYEVCSALKAIKGWREIPVIFLSASQESLNKVKAFEVGGVDYITKPFEEKELVARIENQLKLRRLQQQLVKQNLKLQEEIYDRQLLEEKLRTSEAQIRTFFEAMTDIVMIIDADAHTLQVAPTNPYRLYPPNTDIINQTVKQFFEKQAENFVSRIREALETQQVINFEYSIALTDIKQENREPGENQEIHSRLKNPSRKSQLQEVWFVASITPVTENTVVWVARDISDRKQAELELLIAKERLQHLLTSSPAAIYSCKPGEDFATTFMSENVTAVVGYEAREFLEDPNFWNRHIHPEDAERVFIDLARYLFSKGIYFDEYRFLHKDGTYHWIYDQRRLICDEAGNPIECVGSWTNITSRKTAQLGLQESQRRYQTLTEASPVCIFHTDVDGNCLYVNQRWSEITGLSLEEAKGTGWTKTLHPEDRERVFTEWTFAAEARAPFKSEYRFLRPDGQITWVIGQAVAEVGNDGEILGFVGTITDMSDRKHVEEQLRSTQLFLDSIIENIPNMLFVKEAKELRFVRFNKAGEKLLGYSREQMLGKNDYDFFPREQADFFTAKDQEVLASGGILDIPEELLQTKNNGIKILHTKKLGLLDQDGRPQYVLGISEDITEWKQTEIALRESEERFYLAVSGTNDGIWDWDLRTNQVYYSPVWMKILGYDENELPHLAETWTDRIHPDDLQKALKDIHDHLKGQTPIYQNMHRLQHKKGQWVWIEVKGKCVRNSSGEPYRMTGTIANITERKQAEAALQQAVLAADAANRAKSEFLANMSHELRTPLNAILGFTQMMNRDSSLSKEHQENLGIINRAGTHLLTLINDILEMSKIEAGRTTVNESVFDLRNLLDELQQMLQFRAESKQIQLSFNYEEDIPQFIKTDEGKLRQVLINLIGNAIKFTEKGSVNLRVKRRKNNRYLGTDKAFFQSLIFEIEDTGWGIAPEEIHLLFEAFGQTATGRKSQQGTGLGLPISRKYVQLMGGDIRVSSTLGVGSLFTFDIQVDLANTTEIQTPQKQPPVIGLAPNQPECRILVVDDTTDNRLLIKKLLTSLGFAVQEAENGSQAIALWESWNPHLIFMDMRMPVMDGYEATKQIKARERTPQAAESLQLPLPKPIIIALTASVFEEQKQAILSAGCDDLVCKPFQEEVFLEKISQHLGIQYVRAADNTRTADFPQTSEKSLTQDDLLHLLSQIPAEWVSQLYDAAIQCRDDMMLAVIEQISSENVTLASALLDLTNNFQFDKIMNLSQNLLSEGFSD